MPRPHLFYVFVRLAGLTERPEFYILPSGVVAAHVKADHAEWIQKPGRDGQAHQPTRMRQFLVTAAATYRDKWDVLGLPAAEAKVVVPPPRRTPAQRRRNGVMTPGAAFGAAVKARPAQGAAPRGARPRPRSNVHLMPIRCA